MICFIASLSVLAQAQGHLGRSDQVLKLYPNPATSAITIDFQKDYHKGYLLVIFNSMGQQVLTEPNLSEHNIINLDNFPRGMYVYQLYDKKGNTVDNGRGSLIESSKFQVSK